MHLEISQAVAYFSKFLSDNSARPKFEEQLTITLKERFSGHWDAENPNKGGAYRSISRFDDSVVDPVIAQACQQAGCSAESIQRNLPRDFIMWIDPMSVSYRIGEHGSIVTLFGKDEKKMPVKGNTENYFIIADLPMNLEKTCPSFITLPQAPKPVKITAPNSTVNVEKPCPTFVTLPPAQKPTKITARDLILPPAEKAIKILAPDLTTNGENPCSVFSTPSQKPIKITEWPKSAFEFLPQAQNINKITGGVTNPIDIALPLKANTMFDMSPHMKKVIGINSKSNSMKSFSLSNEGSAEPMYIIAVKKEYPSFVRFPKTTPIKLTAPPMYT